MPVIENNYNYLNAPTTYGQMELNDTYNNIKAEYFENPDTLLSSQKQHHHHLINDESTCALSLPSVSSSGQSSPQQSVPTLLMPLCGGYTSDENNNNPVQIKTEDFQYEQLDFESVSSSEPSPVTSSFHDFDIMLNSQVSQPSSYHSHPQQKMCNEDDATSENSYPSPGIINNELHFESSYHNYYDGLSRSVSNTTLEQGVQMPMDQMRFIIYEPANATDGPALVPTINSNTSSIVQQPSLWPSMAPVNPSATVAPTISLFDYMQSHHHHHHHHQNTLPGTSLTPPAPALPQSHPRTHSTTQGQTTQQTPIKCPQPDCPKTFSRLYNLKAHLRSHSPARPYQCPMCPRSFSRKHDLQRHIRVHTGVKPYQCPACHKAFARTDALRRHLKVEPACRESEACQNMKSNRKRYNQDLH